MQCRAFLAECAKYCEDRMQICEFITHIVILKKTLKLIVATVGFFFFASLFSTFERQVLIGAASHTDGCCCCVADCRIAITQQFDSEPFLLSCLTPVLFEDFLKVLPIFTCCSSYFLTECVLTSSTNSSESMLLKCALCLQSLRSTCKLLMGKKQFYTKPLFQCYCLYHVCTHCHLYTHS